MTNRLARETSPYLLQHANNPVDWYPWGDEALSRAAAEDKPLLVSIGYAACHWCHVMERESFEDAETARDMNDGFVCIKVDREERPDLDSVYMAAAQTLTGHGGWPLTVFCFPDGTPFYAGTYFPPVDRQGLPSLRRILQAVTEAWNDRRDDLRARGADLATHIARTSALGPSEETPDDGTLHTAARALLELVDPEWGGFGGGMKFPNAPALEFLLRMHRRGVSGALDACLLTLDRMARGGIFDQAGGGFHRYSVDRLWMVPHFEKMLSDNAQLLRLYARAWLVSHEPRLREVAEATGDYLLREMRRAHGAFAASMDADSDGGEGTYYVWPFADLIAVAGDDMPLAVAAFAAAGNGNWDGVNVLWLPHTEEEIAAQTGMAAGEVRAGISRLRKRLRLARDARPAPAIDDKVLAGWNGLAIAALAESGRALGRRDFVAAAVTAAPPRRSTPRTPHRSLARAWREDRTSGPAFLEDYAAMADACLTLYETTFDVRWWDETVVLASEILQRFPDTTRGGFYDTPEGVSTPVARPKDLMDGATPSGNSSAAEVLLRIAALSGDPAYEAAAIPFVRTIAPIAARAPLSFAHALCALDRHLSPSTELAIIGNVVDADARALVQVAHSRFAPSLVLAAGPEGTARPPLLEGRTTRDGHAAAYVCEGFSCKEPVTDPRMLALVLDAGSGRGTAPE